MDGTAMMWRVVDVPFDVEKAFGSKGRIPVKGTVNGASFRTSLFPVKNGPHLLMINKRVQQAAGISGVGELLSIEIERDDEERTIEVPEVFERYLAEDSEIQEYFSDLNYSTQKYLVDHIIEPKSVAAQERRAEQIMVRLIEIRDGEFEPPPILQAMFAHNPRASAAWKALTPQHKRDHLFYIFASNNPEIRQKRATQAIQKIIERVEKKKK